MSFFLHNPLFDLLDEILLYYKCTIRALDWSKELGFTKSFQYGSKLQFNGRQCKKLLDNLHIFIEMLKKAHALDYCLPLINCLEKYKIVEDRVFGMDLDQKYRFYITDFANSYLDLMKYVRFLN